MTDRCRRQNAPVNHGQHTARHSSSRVGFAWAGRAGWIICATALALGLAVTLFPHSAMAVEDMAAENQANASADSSLSAQASTDENQSGQTRTEQDQPLLLVVAEVNGLIDGVAASYLREQIVAATNERALALVLQLDSSGTTLSPAELTDLLIDLEQAAVPVGVWVGPSGATARGGAAHLLAVADFSALAPGSTVGEWRDLSQASRQTNVAFLGDALVDDPTNTLLGADEAVDSLVASAVSPSIGDFLLALGDAEIIPPIAVEVTTDDGRVQRTLSEDVSVAFVQLSLLDSLFHTAASPAIAYLLLLVGLSMVLLDFFTGGVGVAAAVGVGSMALSAYGLGELDIRVWALVVLVASVGAYAIDLQAGIPRFWTAVGSVLLVVGTVFLFGRHALSWLPLITGVGLMAVFMLFGMPALIRTRYGTAAVSREWLIGQVGIAVTDIDPEGVLEVNSARWGARASRSSGQAAALRAGEQALVTGLSGVVLEVEPQKPS